MKKILFFLSFLCLLTGTYAQMSEKLAKELPETSPVLTATENAPPFAAFITAADMKSYLEVLASDEFEGRETGTEGQRKAAEFIASHFEQLGYPKIGDDDSYFQKIAFTAENWKNGQVKIKVNGKKYRHLVDYYSIPSMNTHRESFEAEDVLFLGYGIDDPAYSDYKGVDVKGKTLLIYAGEPVDKDGVSHLTGSVELSGWSSDPEKKLEAAYKNGAEMVLVIDPDVRSNVAKYRSTLLSTEMKMGEGGKAEGRLANSMFISSTLAKDIVGGKMKKFIKTRDAIKRSGNPKHLDLKSNLEIVQNKYTRQLMGSNVLAYLEGSDPGLKEELVVVTAHYDHLGMRGNSIYHGADDNGSGTSAVMNIAKAFMEAKKKGAGPRRSVLFMLVSGEEKGLLGSGFYSEHPVFPLENTVANVNVDMIGRIDKRHEDANYIYVIGADRLSTDLHKINEAANTTYTGLDLDYTYNARNDPNRFYYRSDHYNFAKNGIPSVFFFSGTHEDYHRTSDTVDKILFDKMEKIARLVFYTTWELANRDERIKVDVEAE